MDDDVEQKVINKLCSAGTDALVEDIAAGRLEPKIHPALIEALELAANREGGEDHNDHAVDAAIFESRLEKIEELLRKVIDEASAT